jgi:alginate O-acetyltransferase complex protein AlgI
MPFTAPEFIFAFLPFVIITFFCVGTFSRRAAEAFLIAASLAFYAWWDYRNLAILLPSIAWNYVIGRRILVAQKASAARAWMCLGVGANLSALAYFKYTAFILGNLASLGVDVPTVTVQLPLGISFFTFTQIAFLVDAFGGKVRGLEPAHYSLFVSYFPHLIAGPIIHHKEMMPQFAEPVTYSPRLRNIYLGFTLFCLGLVKKVAFADSVAPIVDHVFSTSQVAPIGIVDAWAGALAYALQIYFDFSGYTDMALGMSAMLGIALPPNFNSPYRADSIVEFWRRWHMTLSRFLRDYLYIPLGGNRRGKSRRYVNLLVTMLLGGLWHGASWTFIAWGGLHGVYLTVNHLWRDWHGKPMPRLLARPFTLLAVVVAWVFFRAENMTSAVELFSGMVGLSTRVPAFTLEVRDALLIAVLLTLTQLAPSSQDIIERLRGFVFTPAAGWLYAARVTILGAQLIATPLALTFYLALALGVFTHTQSVHFIYFNF